MVNDEEVLSNIIEIELLNDVDFYEHKELKSGIIKVDKIISLDDYRSALIINNVRYDIKNDCFRVL